MQASIDNQQYRLGCPIIDHDHAILLAVVDRIEIALFEGQAREVLERSMDELRGYVDAHFDNEEELMVSTGYPALISHKAAHDAMRSRVEDLAASLESDAVSPSDAVKFLRDWLDHHMGAMDRELAAYLNQDRFHALIPSGHPANVRFETF